MYRFLRLWRTPGFWVALFILSLVAFAGCAAQGGGGDYQAEDGQPLFIYVGANLKEPVSELIQSYEAETGVKIEQTYQNAGALLNQIATMKKGDLYIPGGMDFALKAREQGHGEKIMGPIAYHTPVIVTPLENPAKITSILDLAGPGVELVIPDLEATAIGVMASRAFDNTGLKEEIEANIVATRESPAKVLGVLTMGQGNAGIVEYSNTARYREELKIIEIDPRLNEIDEIPIVSLVYTTNQALAENFMEYMVENGPSVFEGHGFKTPVKE